ncbi:hypothetical protein [Haladaptatus sp. ZSTT2]|uniref:hypothetical protein n=1 Tax=Haladaptatus sp. ZSTT2 TaxID=3120515 RepID=UPI00300E7D58
MGAGEEPGVEIDEISPMAWRLLRTAAGYEQREVERQIDGLLQAHISMLEGGSRGLSHSRRTALFSLYAEQLRSPQIHAIVAHF